MKISLRQLEVFAAIAGLGHVTRAAAQVAMTQSAASMALADLEQQLGHPLFDRVGRQLMLNEAGRALLPKALEVLDRVREIESGSGDAGLACELHLGASLTIGNHLMPPLLAEMARRHPAARLRLKLENTEQVVAELLAHRLDAGFVEGPVQDARLLRYTWRNDRLCVFVAATHPLAGRSVDVDALRDVPWVLREPGSGTRDAFERAVATVYPSPRVVAELAQPEAIRQAVRAGLGVGCLSVLELQDAFQAGWLAPVETHFLNLERRFQVLLHRDRYLSEGLRAVLALCGIDGV